MSRRHELTQEEAEKESVIKVLGAIKAGGSCFEEIDTAIHYILKLSFKKGDILLVQKMGDIIKYHDDWDADETDEWQFHWEAIATGKYPLEKLPDHVRDLAKTLYYN